MDRAAEVIRNSDALLICAGAGMGVDSGLPDFRGTEGFWKAYPPFAKLGLSFVDVATPEWFERDPTLIWGFYGHRLNLYRATRPHAGFQILRQWMQRAEPNAFVFTSNVDGHFQLAGFDPQRVVEVHGSLHRMQCTAECGVGIFAADSIQVDVDENTFRARDPLPKCPQCGALARPNVLMFNDGGWDGECLVKPGEALTEWRHAAQWQRLAIIECGAGTAIPTVRRFSEDMCRRKGTLIRINAREADVPAGQIGIANGALEVLAAIDQKV